MKKGLLLVTLVFFCPLIGRAQNPPVASTTSTATTQSITNGTGGTSATTTPAASSTVPATTTSTSTVPAATTPVTTGGTSAAPISDSAKTASVSPADSNFATTKTYPGGFPPSLSPDRANPVRVPRFETRPAIDGKLDDGVWQQSVKLGDFYQIGPGDNITASRPTVVMIGYDSRFLYFGFRAYDEPDKVRATVAKRDEVFSEDNVRIFLDTFNDQRKAYVLGFNPLGIQADGIRTEGQDDDYSVDIVMESKGVMLADGWSVEVAIPFKSLRYVAGKDKLWGFHVWRNIDRFNDEIDSWMPISRDNSAFLSQAGHLTGLEGISTERTVEIIPSLTLSETGRRTRTMLPSVLENTRGATDPGRFVNSPVDFDPGLTAKFQLSPNATFDLALNPDFAQVEADATVVTTNQRFPIFFPEKRPFFLEGIDIFNTLIAAVHTRTIVDPDAAVKFTGKRGRNTYGVLLASDNAPGNFSEDEITDPDNFPDIERFIDKNATIGVLRLKRDFGKENHIGFIGTTYNFVEKHNHIGGFDARFRLNKTTTLTAQAIGSNSRRFFYDPVKDESVYRTGNGMVYAFNLNSAGRHWGYEYAGVGRSKFFRADVGFNRRFNTNNQNLFIRYDSEPKPKAKIVSWRIFNNAGGNFDWRGRSQFFNNNTQFSMNFQRQTFMGVGFTKGYERLFEDEFGPVRLADREGTFAGDDAERSTYTQSVYAYAGTTPNKQYSFFFLAEYIRGAFDFDFGADPKYPRVSPAALTNPDAPRDPGPGNLLYLESNITYKPIDALRASLDYTRSRLIRNDTGLVAFDDNIISLRSTYQFTRFTFARARIDYSTLNANVRAQFLGGWTPNPGTSFYVGYNDDLNRNGYNPFDSRLEPGFRRNGRTFFIKMSYLIRKSFGN